MTTAAIIFLEGHVVRGPSKRLRPGPLPRLPEGSGGTTGCVDELS